MRVSIEAVNSKMGFFYALKSNNVASQKQIIHIRSIKKIDLEHDCNDQTLIRFVHNTTEHVLFPACRETYRSCLGNSGLYKAVAR